MSLAVQRNPFARASLRRFTHVGIHYKCRWCGQHKKRLYSYAVERDDNTRKVISDGIMFCDLQCYHSYYGT